MLNINSVLLLIGMLVIVSCQNAPPEPAKILPPKLVNAAPEPEKMVPSQPVQIEPPKPLEVPEKLDDIILDHASQGQLAKPSDLGRKTLNDEMMRSPGQLAEDLPRFDYIYVDIKGVPPVKIIPKGIDHMQTYKNIVAMLHKDCVDKQGNQSLSKDKLGMFFMAEVIYPVVQNFPSVPLLKFSQNHEKDLPREKWGSPSGDPRIKQWADIICSPDSDTITVKSTNQKILIDLATETVVKIYKLISSVTFNKASGKVNFVFSYELEGKKNEWTDNAPFSQKGFFQKLKKMFGR